MWSEGTLRINNRNFTYTVKHYDEPSIFGILDGRISKLEIRLDGEVIMCRYERGWDIKATDKDAITALGFLLRKYN